MAGGALVKAACGARIRSCRWIPSTPRSPRRCAAALAARCGAWSSRRRAARSGAGRGRSLAAVTPGAGAAAPQVGHGPGGHHQLGDPGEQGARGDRGALAVRHALRSRSTWWSTRSRSCTRWWSSWTAPPSRRRRRRTCDCRSRSDCLARPRARRVAGPGLDAGAGVGVRAARRRRLPGYRSCARGGRSVGPAPRRLQRGQRAVRGRLCRRARCRSWASWTRCARWSRSIEAPGDVTLDAVDAAEAWARTRADALIAAR